jgi:quinol monooxygenase YgiN
MKGELPRMPNIDKKQVVCVAEFHAIEGKTDQLVAALHVLMKPTHQEEGCLRYELNQRADDPRWVTFIEKWKNKEIFDKHCAMPYIADYFENVRPKLVDDFSVKLYNEVLP